MRLATAMYWILAGVMTAHADAPVHKHDHVAMDASILSESVLRVTINPEARVSVVRVGVLPHPVGCGQEAELRVEIVNQGSVTSTLEATLVGDVPTGTTLSFPTVPLTGAPEESRALRISMTTPDLADLTVAFRSRNEPADLSGRDRAHLLLRCSPMLSGEKS
jgi:hypothetical protein